MYIYALMHDRQERCRRQIEGQYHVWLGRKNVVPASLNFAFPRLFLMRLKKINSFINSSFRRSAERYSLPFACIIVPLLSCAYSQLFLPPAWQHPPYYEVQRDQTSTFAPDAPFELQKHPREARDDVFPRPFSRRLRRLRSSGKNRPSKSRPGSGRAC